MHFTSHGNKIVPFQCNICKFIMACLWRGYHLSLFASTSWEKLIKRAPGNCYTAKLTSYHDKLSHGQTDQLSWQTEKMKSLDSNRVEITQCRFYWQFWFLGSDFSISNQAAEVQLYKIRLSFTLCYFFFFFFFFFLITSSQTVRWIHKSNSFVKRSMFNACLKLKHCNVTWKLCLANVEWSLKFTRVIWF